MSLNEVTSPLKMTTLTETKGLSLLITAPACQRIKVLVEKEKKVSPSACPYLQIRVEGGGCSGFQYRIHLVTQIFEDDILFQAQDIEVGIDLTSLELLNGSVLNYEENMMSASFVIKNPNATSGCGCGNSFSMM